MRSLIKYILIVFVILIVVSGVFALFQSPPASKVSNVTLSTVVGQINDGKVKSISVQTDNLTIVLNDNTQEASKKETGVGVGDSLTNLGADKTKLAAVNVEIKNESGLTAFLTNVLPIVLPFLFVLLIFWFFFRQAQRGAATAFSFGKSKAKIAGGEGDGKKKITFKDVAGLVEAKEEVNEMVEFLRDPRRFQKLGARMPRGILLVGAPGTGKTLLAKAVANEAAVPFYYVSGSEFVEMFVGVGAQRVRDTFETAKKTAPSIIFIDEIDAIGRHRGAGLGGGHDEREQTLNQILVEMDGFGTDEAVVIFAATNRPDILDPALLRPGRFDRRIILDEPSINDREAILKIHAQDKPLAKSIDLRKVAERTPGFSGADLANLINEGAILAARKNQKEITQDNLFEAIEKVILGPERRSHIFSEKEKNIAAFHEAGHALVTVSVPHADPIHKVSIVSRGRAGGYTLKLPTEDKHLRSRSEFESELAILLAGYTAEQLKFNELTTGAANDLKVASELARKMVTQYGMSEKIGPVTFGEKEELVFLGKDLNTDHDYSEATANLIDSEISRLIENGHKKAKEVLTKKMEILERIAGVLMEKETIEQKEFYELVKA
ncbi:MAG: ATP-dependent zinc metalloprotease FtsH [Minisyncoccia bacterium]